MYCVITRSVPKLQAKRGGTRRQKPLNNKSAGLLHFIRNDYILYWSEFPKSGFVDAQYCPGQFNYDTSRYEHYIQTSD